MTELSVQPLEKSRRDAMSIEPRHSLVIVSPFMGETGGIAFLPELGNISSLGVL